jgi:outer membrane protein OmpA-like peptidoglycan-associated protein
MNGCPDSDGDGLSDIEDACPNRSGSVEMGGCPDTDSDGINDKDDACPEVAGPAENNGCPWPDADSDGVADKDDACPELAGIAANNGCPELPQDVIATLNEEGSMIRFKAESAEIIGEDSVAVLTKIKGILDSYPTYSFIVEGHASSDGSKGYNQKLSQERADAVQAALVAAGADATRVSTAPFGEERPIGDNNTAKGRKSNRRVQFAVGK